MAANAQRIQIRHTVVISVSYPDLFFTDLNPGIFSNPDPDPGKKTNFFKGDNKILGEIFIFNPKSRYFIFVFNQSSTVGILLNRELLFGKFF